MLYRFAVQANGGIHPAEKALTITSIMRRPTYKIDVIIKNERKS